MSTYYNICPECGAHLDPCEKCDCQGDRNPITHVYVKRPIPITALKWTGQNHKDMETFLNRENFYYDNSRVKGGLIIKTLEGEHVANIGDFIIRGIEGEYYPCKPDIFYKSYIRKEKCNGHQL